jgi:hypothetical protein
MWFEPPALCGLPENKEVLVRVVRVVHAEPREPREPLNFY